MDAKGLYIESGMMTSNLSGLYTTTRQFTITKNK